MCSKTRIHTDSKTDIETKRKICSIYAPILTELINSIPEGTHHNHGAVLVTKNSQKLVRCLNHSRKPFAGFPNKMVATHAEIGVVKRMTKYYTRIARGRSRKMTEVDLIVIRINRTRELKDSKPCFHCISMLANLKDFGYRLNNIYYSTSDGDIYCEKFTALYNSPVKHISAGWRLVHHHNLK